MNLNPVASGNKTQSGIGGLISLAIGGAVMAVLKNMGIDDATGAISGAVASTVISGGLFVWGLIHRAIKAENFAKTIPAPSPVTTSIDPAPKQPESVPERVV